MHTWPADPSTPAMEEKTITGASGARAARLIRPHSFGAITTRRLAAVWAGSNPSCTLTSLTHFSSCPRHAWLLKHSACYVKVSPSNRAYEDICATVCNIMP